MKGDVNLMRARTVAAVAVSVGIVILIFIGFRALPDSYHQGANVDLQQQAKVAPDFELKSLDGRTAKLSDYRGKIVLLNFWATWCAPCRVEMPALMDLYDKYRAQGLEIIGVSMDDGGQERVGKFVNEMKINYPILLGNSSVADNYGGLRLLPQTVIITRDGKIVQTAIGMRSRKDFETIIEQLLAAQP
jgi:peroxiredoxin